MLRQSLFSVCYIDGFRLSSLSPPKAVPMGIDDLPFRGLWSLSAKDCISIPGDFFLCNSRPGAV